MALIFPDEIPAPVPIALESRSGNPIDNGQAHELTLLDWHDAGKRAKNHPQALVVNKPCPIYNCHGLTFGSRRTQITPDRIDFTRILEEDDYAMVEFSSAQPGDVILYIDSSDYSITHSGIVVRLEPFLGSEKRVPFVWSKWGKGQECIHHYSDCPYSPCDFELYRLKEWRQRS